MLKFWKKESRPIKAISTPLNNPANAFKDGVGIYCPRCDRPYLRNAGETHTELMNRVKDHVSQQHPDHDPEWFDTYPDHED